jgi:hypothetical protein
MEDRINYFERMLADNPDNPTGLLALANEYQKAERYEDWLKSREGDGG